MVEIRTIAVIGAGALGRGIAHACVMGGFRTILEDILPASLRNAAREIRGQLAHAAGQGVIRESDADAAFSRLEYASTVEQAAREADLVIEAVPEEMESKVEIFILLDKICRPATILAANTSALSVAEIASVTYRASRVLGMRFVDPVHEMAQIEIVRAPATDEETVAACREVGRRMGKQVVIINDGLSKS